MKKNIKHFKQWFALLLAVVLVAGICVYSNSGSLWATEGDASATDEGDADTPEESEPQEIIVSEEVSKESETGETEAQPENEAEDAAPEAEEAEVVEGEESAKKEEAPIPETEEPVEEEKKEVERSVEVTSSLGESSTVEEGTPLTLTAHLTGFDDVEYEIQWQQSEDGANWEDVEGENDFEYTVILTKDKEGYLWRASVSTFES